MGREADLLQELVGRLAGRRWLALEAEALLRVVAGLEAPQAGTVRLDGRLVAGPGTRVPPEARGVPDRVCG
jgi:hypothetical protein